MRWRLPEHRKRLPEHRKVTCMMQHFSLVSQSIILCVSQQPMLCSKDPLHHPLPGYRMKQYQRTYETAYFHRSSTRSGRPHTCISLHALACIQQRYPRKNHSNSRWDELHALLVRHDFPSKCTTFEALLFISVTSELMLLYSPQMQQHKNDQ